MDWANLFGVTPRLRILKDASKSKTQNLRDFLKLWRRETTLLKRLFSVWENYERKLKQAESRSKLMLLICQVRNLRYTLGGYNQKMSKTFCSRVKKT